MRGLGEGTHSSTSKDKTEATHVVLVVASDNLEANNNGTFRNFDSLWEFGRSSESAYLLFASVQEGDGLSLPILTSFQFRFTLEDLHFADLGAVLKFERLVRFITRSSVSVVMNAKVLHSTVGVSPSEVLDTITCVVNLNFRDAKR